MDVMVDNSRHSVTYFGINERSQALRPSHTAPNVAPSSLERQRGTDTWHTTSAPNSVDRLTRSDHIAGHLTKTNQHRWNRNTVNANAQQPHEDILIHSTINLLKLRSADDLQVPSRGGQGISYKVGLQIGLTDS
jgi:hypothetical protein